LSNKKAIQAHSKMRRSSLAVILAGLWAIAAPTVSAESPPPFQEFSFKRVGPPKSSSSNRITVQIDPEEQARVLAPPEPPEQEPESEQEVVELPSPVQDAFSGFWGSISPSLSESSPARLQATLAALDVVEDLVWPRLDDLKRITDKFGRVILRETVGTQVSPALVAAIIAVESSGRVDAVSSAGAAGLMQLMPATAERFGVTNRSEPAESIKGGVAYLNWLMGEFGQDPVMILAGYNAGEGAVRNHDGVPPYSETRAYVPKVLAAFRVASGLCRTPPELISDACVFVGPDS
jgi:hypothetical protein